MCDVIGHVRSLRCTSNVQEFKSYSSKKIQALQNKESSSEYFDNF
jgi:hypothetical protein